MPNVKITYDKKADAANITFQKGRYHISEEIGEGVIVDYTKQGKILSIEILDVSKRIPLQSIKEIMGMQAAIST
jgi:uncharacterized protein YuzE